MTSSVSSTRTCPSAPRRSSPSSPTSAIADGTRRGWVRSTITHDAWEAEYRAVEDITDADSAVTVAARFRIDAGTPGARRLDR